MPTDTEIAWAAGLYEGEGSCSVTRDPGNGRATRYSLSLEMADEDVVRRFAAIVGHPDRVCRPARRGEWRQTWRFVIGARADVGSVLRLLLPYLGERRRQRAEEALAEVERPDVKRQPGRCLRGHPRSGNAACAECQRESNRNYMRRTRSG